MTVAKDVRRVSAVVVLAMAALAGTVRARAAVVTNTSTPVNIPVFIPCAAGGAGETVTLTGNLHTLASVTIDSSGGIRMDLQFQPQGISGAGSVTGDKYQATGLTRMQVNSTSSGTFETTFVNRFGIIGQGPGNNFTVHETAHITVLADGTVTVFFDNFGADCK